MLVKLVVVLVEMRVHSRFVTMVDALLVILFLEKLIWLYVYRLHRSTVSFLLDNVNLVVLTHYRQIIAVKI